MGTGKAAQAGDSGGGGDGERRMGSGYAADRTS